MTTTNTQQPNLLALSDLTQKDRIQILLAEYASLRYEILARTSYGFQIMAIFTWIVAQSSGSLSNLFWIVLTVIGIGFCISIFVNIRDLKKAAYRVKELEHEINSRAGEHLLIWESLSGALTRMGLIRSFFSRIEPLPRAELRDLDSSYLTKANQPSHHTAAQPIIPPDDAR